MGDVVESVRVDERGRVQFSAGMRKRAGLQPGDELLVWEEAPGVFRVQTRVAAIHALMGCLDNGGVSAVDQLIAMRREEAAAEEAKFQERYGESVTGSRGS